MKDYLQKDADNVRNIIKFVLEAFNDKVYNVRIEASETFKILLVSLKKNEFE